jgi:hypothetical protein
MAEPEKAKRYPTDLTDGKREIVRPSLPKDFPPRQTVYWWFRRFVRRLLFRAVQDVALTLVRELEAREQSPSAASGCTSR